ncbi:hypothetical protein EJ08DRAFT_657223 [Tothia fuscella]|uniref:Uncharacterized protein n=1 Tax=Tothia fuscella TaxID=1048955 RepID=A0A9P4U255_9PEZI|nr:hypothetical protein EJ08DRAFT_657223 [Tothia fuscella]
MYFNLRNCHSLFISYSKPECFPLEVISEVSKHLEEVDVESGERWPVYTPSSRQDILSFRCVCGGFLDASWPSFGKINGERAILFTKKDVAFLETLIRNARVCSWIKTVTFGIQAREEILAAPNILAGLHQLHAVRITDSLGLGKHHEPPTQRRHRFVQVAAKEKEDQLELDHIFDAVFSHILNIQELSLSSKNSMALSPDCFLKATLPNLRIIKLTLIEPKLIGDEIYEDMANQSSGLALTQFLSTTPQLKTLDLCVNYSNKTNFRSFILANLARSTPSYRLKHLTLENALMSEDDFARFFQFHAPALKTVLLMLPWLRPGHWMDLLERMKKDSIMLDYLEIWKPSQGALEFHENHRWIEAKWLSSVAREGKLVPFKGETDPISGYFLQWRKDWGDCWDNYYPREGSR